MRPCQSEPSNQEARFVLLAQNTRAKELPQEMWGKNPREGARSLDREVAEMDGVVLPLAVFRPSPNAGRLVPGPAGRIDAVGVDAVGINDSGVTLPAGLDSVAHF